jgi:hypothetical protein
MKKSRKSNIRRKTSLVSPVREREKIGSKDGDDILLSTYFKEQ